MELNRISLLQDYSGARNDIFKKKVESVYLKPEISIAPGFSFSASPDVNVLNLPTVDNAVDSCMDTHQASVLPEPKIKTPKKRRATRRRVYSKPKKRKKKEPPPLVPILSANPVDLADLIKHEKNNDSENSSDTIILDLDSNSGLELTPKETLGPPELGKLFISDAMLGLPINTSKKSSAKRKRGGKTNSIPKAEKSVSNAHPVDLLPYQSETLPLLFPIKQEYDTPFESEKSPPALIPINKEGNEISHSYVNPKDSVYNFTDINPVVSNNLPNTLLNPSLGVSLPVKRSRPQTARRGGKKHQNTVKQLLDNATLDNLAVPAKNIYEMGTNFGQPCTDVGQNDIPPSQLRDLLEQKPKKKRAPKRGAKKNVNILDLGSNALSNDLELNTVPTEKPKRKRTCKKQAKQKQDVKSVPQLSFSGALQSSLVILKTELNDPSYSNFMPDLVGNKSLPSLSNLEMVSTGDKLPPNVSLTFEEDLSAKEDMVENFSFLLSPKYDKCNKNAAAENSQVSKNSENLNLELSSKLLTTSIESSKQHLKTGNERLYFSNLLKTPEHFSTKSSVSGLNVLNTSKADSCIQNLETSRFNIPSKSSISCHVSTKKPQCLSDLSSKNCKPNLEISKDVCSSDVGNVTSTSSKNLTSLNIKREIIDIESEISQEKICSSNKSFDSTSSKDNDLEKAKSADLSRISEVPQSSKSSFDHSSNTLISNAQVKSEPKNHFDFNLTHLSKGCAITDDICILSEKNKKENKKEIEIIDLEDDFPSAAHPGNLKSKLAEVCNTSIKKESVDIKEIYVKKHRAVEISCINKQQGANKIPSTPTPKFPLSNDQSSISKEKNKNETLSHSNEKLTGELTCNTPSEISIKSEKHVTNKLSCTNLISAGSGNEKNSALSLLPSKSPANNPSLLSNSQNILNDSSYLEQRAQSKKIVTSLCGHASEGQLFDNICKDIDPKLKDMTPSDSVIKREIEDNLVPSDNRDSIKNITTESVPISYLSNLDNSNSSTLNTIKRTGHLCQIETSTKSPSPMQTVADVLITGTEVEKTSHSLDSLIKKEIEDNSYSKSINNDGNKMSEGDLNSSASNTFGGKHLSEIQTGTKSPSLEQTVIDSIIARTEEERTFNIQHSIKNEVDTFNSANDNILFDTFYPNDNSNSCSDSRSISSVSDTSFMDCVSQYLSSIKNMSQISSEYSEEASIEDSVDPNLKCDLKTDDGEMKSRSSGSSAVFKSTFKMSDSEDEEFNDLDELKCTDSYNSLQKLRKNLQKHFQFSPVPKYLLKLYESEKTKLLSLAEVSSKNSIYDDIATGLRAAAESPSYSVKSAGDYSILDDYPVVEEEIECYYRLLNKAHDTSVLPTENSAPEKIINLAELIASSSCDLEVSNPNTDCTANEESTSNNLAPVLTIEEIHLSSSSCESLNEIDKSSNVLPPDSKEMEECEVIEISPDQSAERLKENVELNVCSSGKDPVVIADSENLNGCQDSLQTGVCPAIKTQENEPCGLLNPSVLVENFKTNDSSEIDAALPGVAEVEHAVTPELKKLEPEIFTDLLNKVSISDLTLDISSQREVIPISQNTEEFIAHTKSIVKTEINNLAHCEENSNTSDISVPCNVAKTNNTSFNIDTNVVSVTHDKEAKNPVIVIVAETSTNDKTENQDTMVSLTPSDYAEREESNSIASEVCQESNYIASEVCQESNSIASEVCQESQVSSSIASEVCQESQQVSSSIASEVCQESQQENPKDSTSAVVTNQAFSNVNVPVSELLKILHTASTVTSDILPTTGEVQFQQSYDYGHSSFSQNSSLSAENQGIHYEMPYFNDKTPTRDLYYDKDAPLLTFPIVHEYGHKSPLISKNVTKTSAEYNSKNLKPDAEVGDLSLPNKDTSEDEFSTVDSEFVDNSHLEDHDEVNKNATKSNEPTEQVDDTKDVDNVPPYKSRWERIMERKCETQSEGNRKMNKLLMNDFFPVKFEKERKIQKPVALVQPCSQRTLNTKEVKGKLHKKIDHPLKKEPLVKKDPLLEKEAVKKDPLLENEPLLKKEKSNTKSKGSKKSTTQTVLKKGKQKQKLSKGVLEESPTLFTPDKSVKKITKMKTSNTEKTDVIKEGKRTLGRVTNRGSFLTQSLPQPQKAKDSKLIKSVNKSKKNLKVLPDQFHLLINSPQINIASANKISSESSNKLRYKLYSETEKHNLSNQTNIELTSDHRVNFSSENNFGSIISRDVSSELSGVMQYHSPNNSSDHLYIPDSIAHFSNTALPYAQRVSSTFNDLRNKSNPQHPFLSPGVNATTKPPFTKGPLFSKSFSNFKEHEDSWQRSNLSQTISNLNLPVDLEGCIASPRIMSSPMIDSPVNSFCESPLLNIPSNQLQKFHQQSSNVPSRHKHARSRQTGCICLPPKTLKPQVGTAVFETFNVLLLILEWNVDWLVQQQKNPDPPPIANQYNKVRNFYNSFEEYYNTYLPLMLLETWQRIYVSWTHLHQASPYFCEITSYVVETHSIKVKCQVVFNCTERDKGLFPEEGNIIMIKFATKDKGGIKILGYITDVTLKAFDPDDERQIASSKNIKFTSIDHLQVLILTFVGAYTSDDFDKNQLIRIQVLCNVKSILKQNDALLNVKQSPMFRSILNPLADGLRTTTMVTRNPDPRIVADNVAECIKEIIQGIVSLHPIPLLTIVKSLPSSDRLLVLPPLIEKMKDSYKTKVLLCTRTSKALADIGFNLEGSSVKIAIIGKRADVHQKLRKYLVDDLATNQVNAACKTKSGVPFLEDSVKSDVIQQAKVDILQNCDVILTLIRYCHDDFVAQVCADGDCASRMCCILDEANLCTEPEILIPLLYGMSKLILIGDPDVPSKVCSKTAANFSYNKSMFHRAYELDLIND